MDIDNNDLIYKYKLNRKIIAVAAENFLTYFIDEHQHLYRFYGNGKPLFSEAPTRITKYKFKAITAGNEFIAAIDVHNNVWVTDLLSERLTAFSGVLARDFLKIPGLKIKSISAGYASLIMIDINDDIWFVPPSPQQAGFNVPIIYENNISEYPVKIQNVKAKQCSCFLNIVAIIDYDDNLWTNLYSDHPIVDSESLQQVNLHGHKALYVSVSGNIIIIIDTEYNVWIIEFHLDMSGISDPFLISSLKAHDVVTRYDPNGTAVFFRQAY
jgi:hypothetical protein